MRLERFHRSWTESFDSQNYNDIKKVYSIWICMNEKDNMLEKIYLTKNDIIGISRWKDMYEIVNVVIIRLAKTLDLQTEHELHRFLGALFLPELSAEEKTICWRMSLISKWKVTERSC